MIAMSRCGAICLMVGGPTPLGRGRTDAPGKRIEYIELIWSKDEGNTSLLLGAIVLIGMKYEL